MKVELTMLQKWLQFPFFSIAPFKMMDLYVKTMNISVQIHGQPNFSLINCVNIEASYIPAVEAVR